MTLKETEKYHSAYLQYLEKSIRKEPSKSQEIVRFAENELFSFLRDNFKPELEVIYEVTDRNFIEMVRRQIPVNEVYRVHNKQLGDTITQGLRLYAGFLQSKYNPSSPKQVTFGKHEKQALVEAQRAEKMQDTATGDMDSKHSLPSSYTEGALLQVRSEKRERNPQLRQACIQAYGNKYECMVCGFNFVKAYGELGKAYIEIHHVKPLSETDGEHEVNPETDLVPLCSNCHSMIHRCKDGVYSLEEMKTIYKGIKWNKIEPTNN